MSEKLLSRAKNLHTNYKIKGIFVENDETLTYPEIMSFLNIINDYIAKHASIKHISIFRCYVPKNEDDILGDLVHIYNMLKLDVEDYKRKSLGEVN